MNKGKLFAPFITLLAVAVCLIIMILNGSYRLKDMAVVLLIVLIVFYIISSIIQNTVLKFIAANEEKLREEAEKEGAVIEKEAPEGSGDEEEKEEEYKLPPLTGAMPRRPGEDDEDSFGVGGNGF